jgi:hypothetical protein
MNKPSSRSGTTSPRADANTQGKVFPPDSPVDVPNLPQPPKDGAHDETRDTGQPSEDSLTESSWADNTQPAPYKKNVRISNIF